MHLRLAPPMKWTLNPRMLLLALLIVSYVAAVAYLRARDARGTPAEAIGLAPVGETPAEASVASTRPAYRDRVFVVASGAHEEGVPVRRMESLILLCERGAPAEDAVRTLLARGYARVDILPGAAAATAEARIRRAPNRSADGCTEWRPFAL